jgi:hypothetical protein
MLAQQLKAIFLGSLEGPAQFWPEVVTVAYETDDGPVHDITR